MFAKAQGSVPSNLKPILIKRFGHLVPLYPGEAEHLGEDVHALVKARKHERKQWKKTELTCTSTTARRKAAYGYLNSLRCLQAVMLEVNKRLPIRQRQSLHQIITKSKRFKILSKLDEVVHVSLVPKSSGIGYRPICSFGPVARGAQRMVLELLRAFTQPAPFQFTRLGVRKAIEEALRLIKEEGYHDIAELDIKDHYPSFKASKLVGTLPLPKVAVMQIGMATEAKYAGTHKALSYIHSLSTSHLDPSGIPQGSAASAAIAEWSISKLNVAEIKDVAIICYADNLFLFGKSKVALTVAIDALRSAIYELPGGPFKTELKQDTTVVAGFRMLGCEICLTGPEVTVRPTESNKQQFEHRFQDELAKIEELLSSADKIPNSSARIEGVQAYLRLRNRVLSWVDTYSAYADLGLIEEDLMTQLSIIFHHFKLTLDELDAANDPSVRVRYEHYSSSGGPWP